VGIDTVTLFLLGGAALAVGFLGSLLHRRTGIPDILFLILLGILLGPVFGFFDRAAFQAAIPVFAPLTLALILFDGGLNLSARSVARGFGLSVGYTLLTFIGTIFVFFIVLNQALGFALLDSLAFGAALGGTSGVIVLGLVHRLAASEKARVVLALESVITDVLCVVVALTLLGISKGGASADPLAALGAIGLQFGIALILGLAAGLAWMGGLHLLHGVRYAFVATLAVLLMVYAVTELLGGSGAVAALMFGLVLGNTEELRAALRIRSEVRFDESLKQFHAELSFIVRTFFFVYLGVVFVPAVLGEPATMGIALALFIGILLIRAPLSAAAGKATEMQAGDASVMTLILPRGLAAAALASILAVQMPDQRLGSLALNLTLLIVLFSNITATLPAFLRKREAIAPDAADDLATRLSWNLDDAESRYMARERARLRAKGDGPDLPGTKRP
jgi:cell volume regulation protein A